MKKNHKIKILCLLIPLFTSICSCKKNDSTENKVLSVNHNNLAIAGDGKWDLLGYGYDMTGPLFDLQNASSAPIIDMKRFEQDYLDRINTPTTTEGSYAMYAGATAYDYMKDMNQKQTFGTSVSLGGNDPTKYFATTNFSKTDEDQKNYTYNSKYSYATYESRVRIKIIDFTQDVSVELLKNYLTPLFVNNVGILSAEDLVGRYGTHVLLGISLGGRLKFDYKGSVIKESTAERKLDAIKTGFSIGVEKIFGVNLSADKTLEQKTTITNETSEKKYVGYYYGGTNSGVSFSAGSDGSTSQAVNIANWQQSINVSNCALVGINRSVPLYEFISDPVKKEQVKLAIENYIKARQIQLQYNKVQLYNFYSPQLGHIYTIDPNFATTTPGNWRQIINDPIYVYESQIPGSVPVYIMQHRTRSIYCLTTDNTKDLNEWAPTPYQVFFAYNDRINGATPVYQFYHPNQPGDGYFYDQTYNPTANGWIENTIKFYGFRSLN